MSNAGISCSSRHMEIRGKSPLCACTMTKVCERSSGEAGARSSLEKLKGTNTFVVTNSHTAPVQATWDSEEAAWGHLIAWL
eukprot:5454029-Amphidinium_carterae.1